MSHVPVLASEVVENLAELDFSEGWFVDGTFGRGGHARKILDTYSAAKIIALDRDQEAVNYAKAEFSDYISAGRLEIHQCNFTDFAGPIADRKLIGGLFDLGVSSPQLDQGQRGFSFYHDGPLDMRMDQSQAESAKDIINNWPANDLMKLFYEFGEVRNPRRVVEKIIAERAQSEFATTRKLAELIEKTEGWRKRGHHPATNYFMALRIHVNQELEVLPQLLLPFVEKILMDGRILVITFHSLEDRIVKNIFREMEDRGIAFRVNKKVIVPNREEEKTNPRARSAKLRVIQRGMRA
jgi:16S rRNA (cytosine1402-N4)-methyltransferase